MTSAAVHNGGHGQINLNFVGNGGDFPFINHFKISGDWAFFDGSSSPDPTTLDVNGYPTVITNGGCQTLTSIPSAQAMASIGRTNRYIVRWTGNGTICLRIAYTFVSASAGVTYNSSQSTFTSSAGSGRIVIDNPWEQFTYAITGGTVTDIVLVHEADEAAYDAGEVFSPIFKAAIAEGGIGYLRFLNWFAINLCCMSNWASRKPVGYFTYNGSEMRSNMFGRTSGTSTAYTMAAPSSFTGLVDKATVLARFHVNGANGCTLQVGATAAKPLWCFRGTTVDTDTLPLAGITGHCMYDATLDGWYLMGGNSANGECFLNNGVPPELCLRLCAEVGAHIWFNVPHYALTPMSDFTTQLAAYCLANAPSWMICSFEPSNEVWNTAFGFNQTLYGQAVALAKGWGSNNYDAWYGQALSTMGQAVAAAYGTIKANVKTQTKYRVMGSVQTGTNLAPQTERFDSTKYKSSVAQSGYALDAGSDWTTGLSIANYYTPPVYNTSAETTMAAAYAGVQATVSISGNTLSIQTITWGTGVSLIGTMQAGVSIHGMGPASALIQPGTKIVSGSGTTWRLNKTYATPINTIGIYGGLDDTMPDQFADNCEQSGAFGVAWMLAKYAEAKAFALAHGIAKASCYEGGYSPDIGRGETAAVGALRCASVMSPKLAKLNMQINNGFVALTDGTFTADFPTNYLLSNTITPDDNSIIRCRSVWAVLQDIYQQPRPPQWTGMILFNKGGATKLNVQN